MSMFNKVTKSFQYGEHQVTLETGEIARQAGGAVPSFSRPSSPPRRRSRARISSR